MRKPDSISDEEWNTLQNELDGEFTKGQLARLCLDLLEQKDDYFETISRISRDCDEKVKAIQTKLDFMVEGRPVSYKGNGYNGLCAPSEFAGQSNQQLAWMNEKADLLFKISSLEKQLANKSLNDPR